jgi:hypothetical protein
MEVIETARNVCQLSKVLSALLSPTVPEDAHQLQSVSILTVVDILQDVVWHLRTDEAERCGYLGNPYETEHVGVRNVLPPYYVIVKHL